MCSRSWVSRRGPRAATALPGGLVNALGGLARRRGSSRIIAASYRARQGAGRARDSLVGADLLSPANSVRTSRMRMPIDVAYLDRRLHVIAVRTMRPGLLGMPRPRARYVQKAEAGAISGWGCRPGCG
ncbi:DUF192 domain-containing protein [Streptomyces fungicidicus]|uniref:DUF192 domain-containing protein n=1 Tax=Streptomyces fungicidicus TaxID=68203 RepID=UPI003828BA3F